MERVIQSSMFYNFYLFLSILLCNVDSALVSDSNAYIWISNCIQMFKFMFECSNLPPPLPVVCSSAGIEWAKEDKKASFLSLFKNIGLNGSLLPKHTKLPKGVPYDYSCPSIKDTLTDRICM